jgi:hypothetical protein
MRRFIVLAATLGTVGFGSARAGEPDLRQLRAQRPVLPGDGYAGDLPVANHPRPTLERLAREPLKLQVVPRRSLQLAPGVEAP